MSQRNDLEAVRAAIAEGGAMEVYTSLLSICSDETAASQARVAAGATIMRMSGLFDEAKRRLADETDPGEMTPAQLRKALPAFEKELARLDAEIAAKKKLVREAVVDDESGGPAPDIFA